MNTTLDIPSADLATLNHVLAVNLTSEISVWAFGSRTNGTARRYSDLDLALEGPTRLNTDMLARLRQALSESKLTIKVDVIDLRAVDPAFRRLIEADMLPLQPGMRHSLPT